MQHQFNFVMKESWLMYDYMQTPRLVCSSIMQISAQCVQLQVSNKMCQPTSLHVFSPASQEFTHRSVASGVMEGGHFGWLIWNVQWPEGNLLIGTNYPESLVRWQIRPAPKSTEDQTVVTNSIPAAHSYDSTALWEVSSDVLDNLKKRKHLWRKPEEQK